MSNVLGDAPDTGTPPSGGTEGQSAPEPEPASYTFEGVLSNDGKLNEGYSKAFSQDFREEIGEEKLANFEKNYNSLQGLAKTVIKQREFIDSNRVGNIPGVNSTPEETKAFMQKHFGVPEGIEGYEVPEIENAPEDFQPDGDMNKWWSNFCYENNIPKSAYAEGYKQFAEISIQQKQAMEKAQQQQDLDAASRTTEELMEHWKGDTNKNIEMAKRVIAMADPKNEFGIFTVEGQEQSKEAEQLANNGLFIKLMHRFSILQPEGALPGNAQIPGVGESYAHQFQQHIKEHKDAILDRNNPQHKWASQRKEELTKLVRASGIDPMSLM